MWDIVELLKSRVNRISEAVSKVPIIFISGRIQTGIRHISGKGKGESGVNLRLFWTSTISVLKA